ncbi:NADH-quinone oxidoreductase subunit F [Thermosporothrix hazakensis]|jgi:NADH-quinone oxidoreductase subunit F|uniref:NADH-quinone oxidoreductase subunit F n=1 Tax=Thermosporothrix hazakensis TaxID=644383 RepID=A0A326U051_THEHA|nr:NADH-quinone oxidoreductase subunit NuoF [Thermosporothrix hazakensis]PZW23417.1 NADH-quinone oxidoreductase subunit F [Thermosporothrix hazakensis]GCE47952.1 NADH-quinone oxidoreductase subunit F [Thermosporothrix hazakensis]
MPEMEKFLTKHIDVPGIDTLDVYRQYGGYEALAKALREYQPDQLIEEVKKSGLRGRGGAGFPTGMKWSFLAKNDKPRYLCCNCDESEPGTFKDRMLMEKIPHLLVEGVLITSYACRISTAFIYIRGELALAARQVERAVKEAYEAGLIGKNILGSDFSVDIIVHRGAGAYICGEESALMESLEGKRGYPRLKPPFPAAVGLYGGPTVINNCETLCTVPAIIRHGADYYASFGTEKSKGTRIFCLSGHVKKPGNYELPLGIPMRTLIYDEQYGGGVLGDKAVKAIIPGGSSTFFLGPDKLDTPLDYESIAAAGSMLGSGGVIVLNEDTCIVGAILRAVEFYRDESCGKCTPCREGTFWLTQILERLEHGEGKMKDIDLLTDICSNISGKSFCPLGDAATSLITSGVRLFREEFEYHVKHGHCMVSSQPALV